MASSWFRSWFSNFLPLHSPFSTQDKITTKLTRNHFIRNKQPNQTACSLHQIPYSLFRGRTSAPSGGSVNRCRYLLLLSLYARAGGVHVTLLRVNKSALLVCRHLDYAQSSLSDAWPQKVRCYQFSSHASARALWYMYMFRVSTITSLADT